MKNEKAIEYWAKVLHKIYAPEDETCSWTEQDWKAAKKIVIQPLASLQEPVCESCKTAWKAFYKYARHIYSCDRITGKSHDCSCGLNDITMPALTSEPKPELTAEDIKAAEKGMEKMGFEQAKKEGGG